MDYQLSVNVKSLGETFLENNKAKLENVNEFVIQCIGKNGNTKDKIVKKNDFVNELCNIFDNGVSDLSSINIEYIDCGIRYYFTDIQID